jgi:hypothetical protein
MNTGLDFAIKEIGYILNSDEAKLKFALVNELEIQKRDILKIIKTYRCSSAGPNHEDSCGCSYDKHIESIMSRVKNHNAY